MYPVQVNNNYAEDGVLYGLQGTNFYKEIEKSEAMTREDTASKPDNKIEPFDEFAGLTDFERTLTDICIGWIGKEIGWKQYIKDNADVLLQIAMETHCKEEAYNEVLSFLDTLETKEVQEEPVSEDLEGAARRIATRHSHITGDTYYANDAWFFKKGAQWQKEKMTDKACEWLDNNLHHYWGSISADPHNFLFDFRKVMEE